MTRGILALPVVVAALVAPGSALAADHPWGRDYFPNVPLVTQDGKVVRLYDDLLEGKIVAVSLFYTRCKYGCPLETARLAQVQRLLADRVGKDIQFYSISIEPERDTPEVLKAYARKYGAGPGWTFLTGKPDDIRAVAQKLGLKARAPNPADQDGHSPILMIGNVATGQWMQNSALDNPRLLAMTIQRLLDGWKGNTVGPSYAQAPSLDHLSKGEYLFTTRCSACHTIGKGDGIGPDLKGVTAQRDRAWLARFIQEPDKVLAEGDPIARALFEKYRQVNMPNLRLAPEDVAVIVEYLAAHDPASPAGRAASRTAAAERAAAAAGQP
jgi:protein SCO1/2